MTHSFPTRTSVRSRDLAFCVAARHAGDFPRRDTDIAGVHRAALPRHPPRGNSAQHAGAAVLPAVRPARRTAHPVSQLEGRRSEEHTSELQSLMRISYAVFCLKKKNKKHRSSK